MDAEAYSARLRATIDELRRLDAASEESRAVVELDQQSVGRISRMDAIQQQAMAQAAARSRRQEIARLEAALGRLLAGQFGSCLRCGEDIAEKRLAVDPAATLCITCASGG